MLRRKKQNETIHTIGLDIGSHAVKGVEVVERGPEMVIRSAGSVNIPHALTNNDKPDPGAVVHAIKQLWSSAGFASKKVVLALPPQATYLKWLHLEANNEEELVQTASSAAVRGAPFPAHEAIIDYRVLDSRGTISSNVHFVMLVAASSNAVDNILNIAECAGLEPVKVDVSAAAIIRGISTQRKRRNALWSGQPLAHVLVGARSTTITVVRGSSLEFARTVPVGGRDFTEAIAEYANVSVEEAEKIKLTPGTRLTESGMLISSASSPDERQVPCENVAARLAREIQRSLRFFRSQFAEGSYLGMIGAATLSGGGALLKGLDSYLEEQGIDITSTVNPFTGFSVDAEASGLRNVSDSATAFTTAMGLAVGERWTEKSSGEAEEAA